MDTSIEKIIVRKWADQGVMCLVMFTGNKTHTMLLVCAADDFRKISENAGNEIKKKMS